MTPKPVKTFCPKTASADLARLRKRARRIEAQAADHLRTSMTRALMSVNALREIETVIADVRTFLDSGK